MEIGCVPAKSKTIGLPQVENLNYKAFLRGLFEGDGHVRIKDGKYIDATIATGSEKMRVGLLEKFNELAIRAISRENDPKRWPGTHVVTPRGTLEVAKFMNYIYDGSEKYFLNRKRDVFHLWRRDNKDRVFRDNRYKIEAARVAGGLID